MNEVYRSDTMVVHDDRTPLTIEQAVNLLWQNQTIEMCYPPDFSAENECDIYDPGARVGMADLASGFWPGITKEECFNKLAEQLRGYELYR